MYAKLLAADEQTAVHAMAVAMKPELADEAPREPDRYQLQATDLPPETFAGEVQLLQRLGAMASFYIYQSCRKTISEVTPELAPFTAAFRRLVAALEARRRGHRVTTPEEPNSETGILFSQLYEKFREHRTTQKLWKRPELSHTRDYYPIVRDFISVVGDKPIPKLTKADARKYAEHTMRRTDIEQGTKSRNFDRIKAILRFGEDQFDIASITSPLKVEGGYKRVHQSYKRFTGDELKALFESGDYKNSTFKKPSQFWMPLLGLYTGARIAELAGLELDKIQAFFGCPCYFLSHPEGENEGGKNEFAPRWVPVHPAMIAAGFMEYVELLRSEGHTRLFPCLGKAARDGYAKRATDDFVKYRRKCGVGAELGEGRSAQVFHSFRATLVSAMVERRIDGDTRRALVGHASNEALGVDDKRDVHDIIYDQSEINIKRLLKALSRIRFETHHISFVDSPSFRHARTKNKNK
jgi:integrase